MTADGGRPESAARPDAAFYARRGGAAAGWWSILHPPYTLWHLAYIVIGAALAPELDVTTLVATLLAFFLAVGVAAHALDELHDRPLGTSLSDRALRIAAALSLGGAVALGFAGISRVGWGLVPFIAVGAGLVLLYNLEAFAGRFHSDLWFALAWGAFPVLVAYWAQTQRVDAVALAAAGAAVAWSWAQRALSTPARWLRRTVTGFDAHVVTRDGQRGTLGAEVVLRPIERTLKALTWAVVLVAVALLGTHL